jgi:purine-binding chemotaxis protein CheW
MSLADADPVNSKTAGSHRSQDKSPEHLIVQVSDAMIALPVTQVREILERSNLVPIPRAPAYVMGLMDVRGAPIVVMDFARKLDLVPVETEDATRIVVLDVAFAEGARPVGVRTDKVVGVEPVLPTEDDTAARMVEQWPGDILQTLGYARGELVLVLDLPRVFKADNLDPSQGGDL